MNNSGKVLTIFLVIIAILLVSLTAISIFFTQEEKEKRIVAEKSLERSEIKITSLEDELKGAKKQNFLLEEKNKDADERINSLLDELDLQEGLREEIKLENLSLKEQLDKEKDDKKMLQEQLDKELINFDKKMVELENDLKNEINIKKELQTKLETYEQGLKPQAQPMQITQQIPQKTVTQNKQQTNTPVVKKQEIINEPNVELEKIVVVPNDIPEGRILSVDKETEFVIINLGEKDGVKVGTMLSVYRGNDYLGDIQVTRLQPEMSAADLIPPFSSRLVRKNDQVVLKK